MRLTLHPVPRRKKDETSMRDTRKIVLAPEQEAWLRKHYKHTKNADICERLGVSMRTLERMARSMGLEKSPRFMKKVQLNAAAKAKESHIKNGTYNPKGFIIPRSEEHRFKPGVTPLQRLGKKKEAERLRKSTETMARMRKEERMRIALGLPQETRLRLKTQPKRAAYQRYYLRKLGYIIPTGSKVVYYDENTRRSEEYENRRRCDRHYIWFDYKPLPKDGKI